MGLVQGFEKRRRPRHADRFAAGHGVEPANRPSILSQPVIGRRRQRRRLTPVIGGQFFRVCIPPERESASAEAGALRFHQRQDELHGDGGVGGGAALRQNRAPRLRRQRVCGDYHVVAGGRRLDRAYAERPFRLNRLLRGDRKCKKRQRSEDTDHISPRISS